MDASTTADRNYIAFISYRHLPLDREAAVRIQKKIENYVVPKEYREKAGGKKLGVCFRDEDELPASSSLSEAITYALDHTEYLIVICTPDLPKSRWCMAEVNYFLRTHDRDHVLAVLADGDPEEAFPEQLRFSYDDEGRQLAEVEPLAANIAGENHAINNKTFKKEVTRLIAAMLGCPFDALWQRERRARTNKLLAAMGAGVAAMAVILALVLSKNAQISRQNEQIKEQNDQIVEQMEQIQEQNDQIKEQNDQIKEQVTQIQEQNDQIEKQNTDLQKQLSGTLVSSGRMQLENHDRTAALDSALQALESGDPAIYDHSAELLLADALGAYGYQQTLCDIFYEQSTEIESLAVSENGETVFTGDSFMVVRALSTIDASILWEQPLGKSGTPRIYPLKSNDLVLCDTFSGIAALSTEDGSIVWSRDTNLANSFQMLSPDQSLFVTMEYEDGYAFSARTLSFLDTASGEPVCSVRLPLEDYQLRDSGSYSYEYGGAFSADGTRFVCMIPCFSTENLAVHTCAFFLIDLRDGSFIPLGRLDNTPRLCMMAPRGNDSVYCAVVTNDTLYSIIFPFDTTQEKTFLSFDFSRPSRDGRPGAFSIQDSLYVQPLFSDDLAILFCLNNISIMDLSNGSRRFALNLDTPVVSAEWVDRSEEIFQVVTQNGWCLRYDLSHIGTTVVESLYSESLPLPDLVTAAHANGGFFCDPSAGSTYVVSKSEPQRLLSVQKATDPAVAGFADSEIWRRGWEAMLSPSGSRVFVLASGMDTDMLVASFDTATGALVAEQILPINTRIDDILIPDDDHVLHQGTLYGMDGSKTELVQLLAYRLPDATLLSDGTLLFTRDIPVEFESGWDTSVRVLSYQYGEDAQEHCTLQDGICMQSDLSDLNSQYLYSIGKNGWLAGYGLYTYLDDNNVRQTVETPVLVAQNAATGEKFLLDFTYEDHSITRLTMSNQAPLLAAELDDGQILLYDLEKNILLELPAAYAIGEVTCLCFSDQGKLLLIYTSTGRLDCFALETMTLVYSDEEAFSHVETPLNVSNISAAELSEHRMIVCADRYAEGTCAAILDTDAWVVAARINDYYGCSVKDALLFIKTDDALARCPVHSLEELEKWAAELVY